MRETFLRGADDDDKKRKIVPFVPVRCPRCASTKPRTNAVRGLVRYHICQDCGCDYHSMELKPSEMRTWEPPPF